MGNEHDESGRLRMSAGQACSSNPAHASTAVSVSDALALRDAVQMLLIRAESLLDAAEQCRCRPELPVNVLVPTCKGMICE